MKYFVSWTEYHSAIVEAVNKEEAGEGVYGRFDAETTFDGYDPQHTIGEDEEGAEDITLLTVESRAGMKRQYASQLYDACKEFVRKVECGEARSTRSYKQMKEALNFINK